MMDFININLNSLKVNTPLKSGILYKKESCSVTGSKEEADLIRLITSKHWRRRSVHEMKTSMQRYNVEESIIDTFCSCITDCLKEVSKVFLGTDSYLFYLMNTGVLPQETSQNLRIYTLN